MEYQEIEKLIEAMSKGQLTRLVFKTNEFEIELEKELPQVAASMPIVQHAVARPTVGSQETPKKEESSSTFITSPMVGVFYASGSPGDPPFVSVGDVISEEKIVCIIEAMKVMNEVKAQIKGQVVEVLVKNGEPVEFGTKLFRIL